MGLFSNKEKDKEFAKLFRKYKITSKQEGGDDGYCYCVRINGKPYVNGLTRNEVNYYKGNALKTILDKEILTEYQEKLINSHKSIGHMNLWHEDCPLCNPE